jgi:hypothetical protein
MTFLPSYIETEYVACCVDKEASCLRHIQHGRTEGLRATSTWFKMYTIRLSICMLNCMVISSRWIYPLSLFCIHCLWFSWVYTIVCSAYKISFWLKYVVQNRLVISAVTGSNITQKAFGLNPEEPLSACISCDLWHCIIYIFKRDKMREPGIAQSV